MERVLAAIAELPEMQRLALILQHVEHQDTEEIGRQLGRTPHQVRALCSKGLASLRVNLNNHSRPEVADG
jgi:DNA-directed RNA polymerase specialized sigma24 family protein